MQKSSTAQPPTGVLAFAKQGRKCLTTACRHGIRILPITPLGKVLLMFISSVNRCRRGKRSHFSHPAGVNSSKFEFTSLLVTHARNVLIFIDHGAVAKRRG